MLCAADEIAVELFLSRKIGFTDIPKLVRQVVDEHMPVNNPTIEEILTADEWARDKIRKITGGFSQ